MSPKALLAIGIILLVIGGAAIAMAPQIMNSAEVDTLRMIGAGIAFVGVILAGLGFSKKNGG